MHTRLVLRPGDSIEFRNGARLMFGPGGYADWQGTPTSTWSNDGQTQNIERDVVIFGNGSIMFMQGSLPSTIKYVEIDLRPKQVLGHYPLHWHLAGDSVRGTLVEGVVVKNSTNRAYVPHGSHGITIRDSIAKDIQGEAFWWDQPNTNAPGVDATDDLVLERNLVDGVSVGGLADAEMRVRLSAFSLRHGDDNVIRNSVVRNMAGSKDCSAYFWPEKGQSEWVFENNKNFGGSCNGIFVWQNNSELGHIIKGYASDKEGQVCIRHGAYVNNYQYINVVCDVVEVLAGENSSAIAPRFQGGSINKVVFEEHRLSGVVRFVDTRIGSVHINNGKQGRCDTFKAGNYHFTNTGLTFSDITTGKVCAGTKVTIDGVTQSYGG